MDTRRAILPDVPLILSPVLPIFPQIASVLPDISFVSPEIASIAPSILAIVSEIPPVALEVPAIHAHVLPILLHLRGVASRPFVVPILLAILPQVAFIPADIPSISLHVPVVLPHIATVFAYVLSILPKIPLILPNVPAVLSAILSILRKIATGRTRLRERDATGECQRQGDQSGESSARCDHLLLLWCEQPALIIAGPRAVRLLGNRNARRAHLLTAARFRVKRSALMLGGRAMFAKQLCKGRTPSSDPLPQKWLPIHTNTTGSPARASGGK